MANVTAAHSNVSRFRGECPAPFLDDSLFLKHGGHVEGRLCAPVRELPGSPKCCLPCPATDWLYPKDFDTWYTVSQSFSTVGLVICVFLMLSWAFLPVEKTRRHWLSICLVIGITMEALAFVVPLGVKPEQCFDEITPNDMYTNTTCAFSGAFIVAGGLATTVWIFVRSLSMHLQICWDIVPGTRFFYVSQGLGWGVAATLFIVTMIKTGVSFRFGDTCHVNSDHSMADFWGPMLGISCIAGLLQIFTFLYCIRVYLRNVWSDDRTDTNNSAGLPSYHSSMGTHSARAMYQRMKKVLWLQWRSIAIVVFLLVDIIFLAIVWVQLDETLNQARQGKMEHFTPFLVCLVSNGGVKSKCYALGQKAIINEATAIAVLMLLSLTGVQTGLMLSRTSMFVAWYELFRRKFGKRREFVSLDAKRFSQEQRAAHELVKIGSVSSPAMPQTPATARTDMHSPHEAVEHYSPPPSAGQSSPEHERVYRKPTMSFSGPQAPSREGHRSEWSLEEPYVTGALGSHPPPRSPNRPRRDNYDSNK